MPPSPDRHALLLGTAQWGWTVSKTQAFQLLDEWLKLGQTEIDCATNYPINKNPADFQAAEKILLEYIKAHGLDGELEVLMKIGSLNNMRTPDVNLSPSFILMMGEEYLRLFRSNLRCLMVHWDNRDDHSSVSASLEAFHRLYQEFGILPGLSGIAHPDIYSEANQAYNLQFDIQAKHNLLQSDLPRYEAFQNGPHRFLVYGINAGGLKLDGTYSSGSTLVARGAPADYGSALVEKLREQLPHWNTAAVRPPIMSMNHLGLIYAGLHPRIDGILLGVSNGNQLRETMDFWKNVLTFDYDDVWSKMQEGGL